MVEEDGGRGGDVKGVDVRGHRDGEFEVAEGEVLGGEAVGFGAEEEGEAVRAAGGGERLGLIGEDGGGELHLVTIAKEG